MKKLILLLPLIFLVGCEEGKPTTSYVDQDLRKEIFMECLSKVPKGPESVKYNDWKEVVEECGDQAEMLAAFHTIVPYAAQGSYYFRKDKKDE